MAKKPSKPEQTQPRPKPPRVTMTTAGLLTLIYFVDRLGRPDEIAPDSLVFAWPEAGAILITDPDHERCALREDHDDTFFELFGWCAYHHVEVDLLTPDEFEAGADRDEGFEGHTAAATFTHLSPDDVTAFQDVVRGRGGLCMSDRSFHGKDGPEKNPDEWPDTGILVVHQSAGEGAAAQMSGPDPSPRSATLYARNQEWLRTTIEALRKLVENHSPNGRNVQ